MPELAFNGAAILCLDPPLALYISVSYRSWQRRPFFSKSSAWSVIFHESAAESGKITLR